MRLEWIEDILAVIDTGSLTLAAQKRFLTQSAFTRRIRAIEEAMGADLFDRKNRPVQALAHVREQENEMRQIALRLHTLKNALADPSAAAASRVSFACQHTIATTISPRLIRKLTRDGQVNVRVRSSNRDDCLMMLLTSQVDFALIFEALGKNQEHENDVFLEEPLGSDWMIPVIASHYREELLEAMDQQILPIITYPQDLYLGQLFDLAFMPHINERYQLKQVAETGLALAALHYALEGIGVAWLPRSIAVRDLEQGRLLDLSNKLPNRELHVKIVRLRKDMSGLAEQAWNQIAVEYEHSHSLSA
ncbi:MAG: LysR family transcriptional regulator [Granulosicoccus sp.]